MSTFTITIDTANDAFQPEPGYEVDRILKVVAQRVGMNGIGSIPVSGFVLRDINGNAVGFAQYGPDPLVEEG